MAVIKVDGKQIQAEEGELLLDVLHREGFKVPSLCHHKAVLPYASCRLCLVEIMKEGVKSITTSCNYRIMDEIEVTTNSDEVLNLQRMTMELLLARCPGSPELAAYAKEMGIEKTRFKNRTSENTNCILCGLCVRVCHEAMNVGAIGFVNRGTNTGIAPPRDKFSDICYRCGACEFVCPTNHIKVEDICGIRPQEIASEFDAGLCSRGSIYIPFPQAVPNHPVIDREKCMYYEAGSCKACEKFCTAGAIQYDQQDELVTKNVGAIIVSPGFDWYKPPMGDSYGYGIYPNVLTSVEFERMLAASGPYKGHIKRISDGKPPQKVAWLQCVGSRDESCDHTYCSSVCCMYAIKEAVIAQEHQSGLEAHIYFMDMRSFGKDFEKYYERAKNEYGVVFRRSRIPRIEQDRHTKDLTVRYIDEDGNVREDTYNMIVLSVGLQPCKSLKNMSDLLDINLNRYGFVQTNPYVQTLTSRHGIYVSGSATEPKDIPESVTQASAAASEAAGIIYEARGTEISEKEYPPERDVRNELPKIGVIVCHCGINIAGVINVDRVVEEIKKLPYVAFADHSLYTCSQDSLENIKAKIQEYQLNRIVIASCTPRTHEPLFQSTLREAGLNPHLFEMVNLRDQNSWVHRDYPEQATSKAIDSVRMGVAKAAVLRPVAHHKIPVTSSALIIGGGAAGMHAALSIANQGYVVYLIERENELGGHLNELFIGENGEDPKQFRDETIQRVTEHEKIEVFTSASIEEITGYVGNFSTRVKTSETDRTLKHGVIIVATGAEAYEPVEFEYGKSPSIIKQKDLEKDLAEEKAYVKKLKEVVMIQCVGSRNEDHPYCSRVCCANALKNAIKLRQLNPAVSVYVLYRDIRSYGFREDRLYREARKLGVLFIRYDEERQPAVKVKGDEVSVTVFDPILRDDIRFHPDRLVLSTGIIPRDNTLLSQILKVPLNADKFYAEAHLKLRPVDFAVDGIYLCGLAHSPRFLEESILQAKAAGARAATILSKEHLETRGEVAQVTSRNCAGCQLCIQICPYEALSLDEKNNHVVVNEILCQGCGACSVVCPSGASQQNTFSKKQILAMVDACFT